MSKGTIADYEYRFEPGMSDITLLLLHSTGGDEDQLIDLGRDLAPQAALLSPRGQVLENGHIRRFFARFAEGQLDLEDMRKRGDEIAAFVAEAAGEHGRDAGRIIALGYSNGANVAVDLLLRHPGLLRGAVLLRPMLPYTPDPLPSLAGTAVLVSSGASDPLIAPGEDEALAKVLADAGAEVELRRQNAGHQLTSDDFSGTSAWLETLPGWQ